MRGGARTGGNRRYLTLRRPMTYWIPHRDFVRDILETYGRDIRDGDFVVISEKAVAVALGYIFDESKIEESTSILIATEVLRRMWSLLGSVCRLKKETLDLIRSVPPRVLAKHKQLSLYIGGLRHFLKPVSEAGIDASNLPLSLVSLPLPNANEVASHIKRTLHRELGRDIHVLIQDTDKTFVPRFARIGFATRPSEVEGIIDLGVLAYVMGMCSRGIFKAYPTPVGYSGPRIDLQLLLNVARAAESARGWGSGRDVFEMARTFHAEPDRVTWEMLGRIKHYPVVIVRIQRGEAKSK